MADVGLTKAQIIAVCGELADPALSTEEWETIIEIAQAQLNPNLNGFGSVKKANIAGRFLGAHLGLKMKAAKNAGAGIGGVSGPLASVTVGQVSKSFSTSGNVDAGGGAAADLQSTTPGREYARLIRVWAGRIAVS